MTPTPSSSPGRDSRTRLADALRAARLASGEISGAEAGRRSGISQSKVSKIEKGYLLPTVEDVEVLCRVYNVDAQRQEELVALVTKLRGAQSARVILTRGPAEMQKRIRQLEESATLLRSFQPTMVIGLLQTSAYAEVVFGTPDSFELPVVEVVENIEIREGRQEALLDDSKDFVLILTEGALRWQAGSAAVMADQLDALAEATTYPNVRLGIIPWSTSVRFFPRHGFHLYDEDAVIVATETATATMTGEADVSQYVELFGALEDLAVFGDEARAHFVRIGDEYRALMETG